MRSLKNLFKNPGKLAILGGVLLLGGLGSYAIAPQPTNAQSAGGIVLFGKIKDQALDYYLDSGIANDWDRYYLTVPSQEFQIDKLIVEYPETFAKNRGKFDEDRIDLRRNVDDQDIPIESAVWDPESRTIEITPVEPIPPDITTKIVLSNVRNPRFGGIYQFDATVSSVDDLPVIRYVGSWVIDFE
jgi:hypothetical protein